jgi:hypothetical protein
MWRTSRGETAQLPPLVAPMKSRIPELLKLDSPGIMAGPYQLPGLILPSQKFRYRFVVPGVAQYIQTFVRTLYNDVIIDSPLRYSSGLGERATRTTNEDCVRRLRYTKHC